MDNQENMIAQIFKNDIQIKRVRKELQQIGQQLPKHEFKITYKQQQNSLFILVEMPPLPQLNYGKPINCLIYLDNRFPFVFPRVHILSHLTKPTLADGRDYIEDILHTQWSPSVLLFQLIEQLKKFFETIRQNQNDREYLLSLGKFYQDQEFEGNLGLEDVEYFQCKDIINGKPFQRIIQLSTSHILMLEYQNKTQLNLLSHNPTKDLLKIEKIENNIILTWKSRDENYRLQTLQTNNPEQFMDSILAYKTGSSGKKIQEEDVTLQKFENLEIQDLLEQITIYEEELQQNLNQITLNQLMDSYQKAIEYYSAFSDEDYKQYVILLQTLLGREDVQQVLASSKQIV